MRFFSDRRWTLDGLRARLRSEYPSVSRLINLAQSKGTTINAAFQGARIGPFTILSPSQEFYEACCPSSETRLRKTETSSPCWGI